METKDLVTLVESKIFKRILWLLGVIVVIIIIFQVGVFVGYHKAAFSLQWGDNYHRTFGSQERSNKSSIGGAMNMMRGGDFSNAHGIIGKILKIDLPTIVVEGQDNIEKNIVVTDNTIIKKFRNDLKVNNLKVGDSIVVIGNPNKEAEVEATLIRVLPTQSLTATSTLSK